MPAASRSVRHALDPRLRDLLADELAETVKRYQRAQEQLFQVLVEDVPETERDEDLLKQVLSLPDVGEPSDFFALPNNTLLVFIDDPLNWLGSDAATLYMASLISLELMKSGVVERTVRPFEVLQVLEGTDEENRQTPVDAIARGVGAEQVVYIQIEEAGYDTARCRLKVLHIPSRQRLPSAVSRAEAISFYFARCPLSRLASHLATRLRAAREP
jgi:hypothetical protein